MRNAKKQKLTGIQYLNIDNVEYLKNGCLRQKAGWITYGKQKYYVDKNGKRAANCWKSGYYLDASGTIAKNVRTPDGKYVDYRGKKSTKSEYQLSAFKDQLKRYTVNYGGNWSIYVKDLKTGNMINLNDQAMYPASTIKAFVMASAKDCGKLLERIYRGTCVSKKYSQEMLNLLMHQEVRYKIPAGLPSGIVCANKTGETSFVQHDMAIVYGRKTNYVLCVFSSGGSEYHLQNGIRKISSMVYNYLN